MTSPRLYGELAEWFHLLTHPDDYEEEAKVFAEVFQSHARDVKTILELGSGGGNNASHLKHQFELTLTDLSPDMLAISRRLNPECEHIQGDMRTLRLGRRFDALFVHDAIAYITTEADLEATMRTAIEHLEPGGIALFVPDDTTESYRPTATTGGHDGDGRSLRYVQWDDPVEPGSTSYRAHFTYTLREGKSERSESDIHEIGLFPRATWISTLERVGFEATARPFLHSEFAPGAGHELFVGVRP